MPLRFASLALVTLFMSLVTDCGGDSYTFTGGEIKPPSAAAPLDLTYQYGQAFTLADEVTLTFEIAGEVVVTATVAGIDGATPATSATVSAGELLISGVWAKAAPAMG